MSKWFWMVVCLGMAACESLPTVQDRVNFADQLARQKGWTRLQLDAPPFDLIAYTGKTPLAAESLTIFIEGDGFAWINESHPSSDPTPIDPVSLRIALAHPQGNVAYLARPCQYIDAQSHGCDSQYWTNRRFGAEVIASADIAIDDLKKRFGARRLTLIGYSGGGAVAALLATRRSDVDRLITVAGVLDHRAWTSLQRVQSLNGSVNPADEIAKLDHIAQIHFAGGKDQVVPAELIEDFLRRFSDVDTRKTLFVLPDFGHRCCWADAWISLWQKVIDIGIPQAEK